MRATWILPLCLCAVSLVGADLKVSSYEVLPGSYYKHLGTKFDRDLLPAGEDGKVSRKGFLTDGKISYVLQTGICYSFWRAKPEESCVSFMLTLEKPETVSAIKVYGQNLNGIYRVLKAAAEYGEDEISMEPAGEAISISDAEKKKRDWTITVPCGKKAQFVKVTVWTGPNNYLNITEIKLIGAEK